MDISAEHPRPHFLKKLWLGIAIVLAILIPRAEAATVTINTTNSLGVADTNYIKVFSIAPYINADGSVQTTGLPFRIYPNTNGFASTNLLNGWYLATNQFLVNTYGIPGSWGTSQGIIFAVPAGNGTYPLGQLAMSGYNVFNFNPLLGLYTNVIAVLGFTPLTPQQTTNLFLLSNTNQFAAGTNVSFSTNNGVISISAIPSGSVSATNVFLAAGTNAIVVTNSPSSWTIYVPNQTFLTNGLVTAAITNGLATTNFVQGITNGLATIAYVNTATNYVLTNTLATINSSSNSLAGQLVNASNVLQSSTATASNLLQNAKQPASGTLTNLAVTGAFTNQLVAGTNVVFTTNNFGLTVQVQVPLQTVLTNGMLGNSVTNGLASIQYVNAYAYPTNNPQNFVNNTVTNGLANTNWVASNFDTNGAGLAAAKAATNGLAIPSTNGFVTASITNGLQTAQGVTNIVFGPGFLSQWQSTPTNAFQTIVQAATNFVVLSNQTAAVQLFANGISNSGTSTLALSVGASNGVVLASNSITALSNFTTSATASLSNNVAAVQTYSTGVSNNVTTLQNVVLNYQNPLFVAATNGSVYNLTLPTQLIVGGKTNWVVGTNQIGIIGAGSPGANGTYFQTNPLVSIWINESLFSPQWILQLTGGNFYLQSNGVTEYQNAAINGGWTLVNGVFPPPYGFVGSDLRNDGVRFSGNIYATNLTAQAQYWATNLNIPSNSIYNMILAYSPTIGPTNGLSTNALSAILASSNYATVNFTTNLVAVTSNALSAISGVTPSAVTNIAGYVSTNAADNVAMGGVLIGPPTNAFFNTAGSNIIAAIAAQNVGGAFIGSSNGLGTNTTFYGTNQLSGSYFFQVESSVANTNIIILSNTTTIYPTLNGTYYWGTNSGFFTGWGQPIVNGPFIYYTPSTIDLPGLTNVYAVYTNRSIPSPPIWYWSTNFPIAWFTNNGLFATVPIPVSLTGQYQTSNTFQPAETIGLPPLLLSTNGLRVAGNVDSTVGYSINGQSIFSLIGNQSANGETDFPFLISSNLVATGGFGAGTNINGIYTYTGHNFYTNNITGFVITLPNLPIPIPGGGILVAGAYEIATNIIALANSFGSIAPFYDSTFNLTGNYKGYNFLPSDPTNTILISYTAQAFTNLVTGINASGVSYFAGNGGGLTNVAAANALRPGTILTNIFLTDDIDSQEGMQFHAGGAYFYDDGGDNFGGFDWPDHQLSLGADGTVIAGTFQGSGSELTGLTNGLATIAYVNAATNGLGGGSSTNGLATTNYVNAATNGFVTASVTNGLSGPNPNAITNNSLQNPVIGSPITTAINTLTLWSTNLDGGPPQGVQIGVSTANMGDTNSRAYISSFSQFTYLGLLTLGTNDSTHIGIDPGNFFNSPFTFRHDGSIGHNVWTFYIQPNFNVTNQIGTTIGIGDYLRAGDNDFIIGSETNSGMNIDFFPDGGKINYTNSVIQADPFSTNTTVFSILITNEAAARFAIRGDGAYGLGSGVGGAITRDWWHMRIGSGITLDAGVTNGTGGVTNIINGALIATNIVAASSFFGNGSGITNVLSESDVRAGATNLANLAISSTVVVLFTTPFSPTVGVNYSIASGITSPELVASSINFSLKTTNGFTESVIGPTTGTFTNDYIAKPYQ